MFLLLEILESVKRHRSKTFIAGISVAWGLMLLIILVGVGSGLQKGIEKQFSDYTKKTIVVYGGEASISDILVSKGEGITFTYQDIYTITNTFDQIEYISPIISVNAQKISSFKKEIHRFSLFGVNENYFKINTLKLKEGRFFNPNDHNKK